MAANPDVPPAQTIKPVTPPPPSDQPTTAMLKADIDSGRTGDKIGELDPGLSSLGTDDEAAGRPPRRSGSPWRAITRPSADGERAGGAPLPIRVRTAGSRSSSA